MSEAKYLSALNSVIAKLEATQMDAIEQAAEWVTEAAVEERFGVMFGSGHSYMPVMDTFPRIGSFPVWLPIHEISTSYVASVSGNLGLRQAIFLEKVEGFGDVVLENYRLDPRDVMIVISNSGVNPMGIDIALNAKEQGLKTIAITSMAHTQTSESRHSSGKRLFEICDLVIDTCVPQGDAMIDVEGFPARVGAASTIMAMIVMQSMAVRVAEMLAARGISLPVYPSHNAKMTPEGHDAIESMAEDVMKEYTRRTANILK
jgi:uncharacterized phosphosugar-binding protein